MQILKDRIRKDGKIKGGNVLKVDSFLNHQMDIKLFGEIGKEFKRRFADAEVNKILTIEASGIGIACIVAQYFDVPVVFAKKNQTKNIAGEVHTTKVESFTHGRVYDIIVAKEFLGKGDKVLIIDDFLANGKALEGLIALVRDSGAELVGAGIVIEKGFQVGGDLIRSEGIRLEDGRYVCELTDGVDFVDAFGHKQLTGTANYLARRLSQEIGCKTRSIELSSLQRAASHLASRIDILEAFQVGGAAVKAADEGDTGEMVILKRISDDPYQCTTELRNVHKVSNVEKTVPREWINKNGTYVTEEFISYVRPLIQGDVSPVMVDGIPRYLYHKKK